MSKHTHRPIVPVTDNAVLCWLERVERVDVEGLRHQLSRSAEVGLAYGAGAVIVSGGKLILREGIVQTVIRREDHPQYLLGVVQAEIDGDVGSRRLPKRRRRRS